ncbi:hypothetical protein ACFQ6Q_00895 [Streptomyces sp. NPDC056437]|uniref:hypothetical protein n=1 Tax=Streptomyces sp. NPDC056437 TaxID=3345816 RepID=UPI00367820DB
MSEPDLNALPATRPVERRVDEASADMGTLIDMGVVEEQPQPPPPEPVEEGQP